MKHLRRAALAHLAVLAALIIGSAAAAAQGFPSPNFPITQPITIPPPIQAAPPPVEAAPPPVEAAPAQAQASRIHQNAAGSWEPDAGCHWLDDDDRNDLRVRCDDD